MTDVGLKRASNQDAFCQGSLPGVQFAVVCDGMGGHRGGNVASELAVRAFYEMLSTRLHSELRTKELKNLISGIIVRVSLLISETAAENPDLAGMGSTVVLAVRLGEKLCIAHVGDSRCYLMRNGKLRQLTKDHSLVQEMIDRKEISSQEGQDHPQRNIITRVLGYTDDSQPEILFSDVKKGDLFLLCTDGLTVPVADDKIQEILQNTPIEQAAEVLIRTALEGGGPDNVTVGILWEESEAKKA